MKQVCVDWICAAHTPVQRQAVSEAPSLSAEQHFAVVLVPQSLAQKNPF
jgi:hypothetical protein